MIFPVLFAACSRHVSPWRIAAAVLLMIGADLVVGIAVAALLGARLGLKREAQREVGS